MEYLMHCFSGLSLRSCFLIDALESGMHRRRRTDQCGADIEFKQAVECSMTKVATEPQRWCSDHFRFVHFLCDAPSNHGKVDVMEALNVGYHVAVKRLPNGWVTSSPSEFADKHPAAAERPWLDVGITQHLTTLRFPYICEMLGVFRDALSTYIVNSFATDGDLFSWSENAPWPGVQREAAMRPLVAEICCAVQHLHNLGVAHRDLSLENILLTSAPAGPRVRICDFGMATLQRMCQSEPRGKPLYQAPEMHGRRPYDAFLADSFALGVVVFAMSTQDYPWTSTQPGVCELFIYVCQHGLLRFLEERSLRLGGGGVRLVQVVSRDLVTFLEGLLRIESSQRLTLGETSFDDLLPTVWVQRWLK